MDKNYLSRKKTTTVILICVLFILAGMFGVGYYLLDRIQQEPLLVDDDHGNKVRQATPGDIGISDDALNEDTGVMNVLLLGVDRESVEDRGRTDTMIIMSIDKNNKEVKLTSLMRDMYMPIPGREKNRINAAYAFGGPKLILKTVNQNFNMDINHYAALGFEGFREVVDLMGGVKIDLTIAESKIVGVNGAGKHLLDGSQALQYARIRRIGADFERTERQRKLLIEMANEVTKTHLNERFLLFSEGLSHVETNLSKLELISLGWYVSTFSKKPIEERRLPADGAYSHQNIRGMAVLVPDMDKNKAFLHEFIYGENKKH